MKSVQKLSVFLKTVSVVFVSALLMFGLIACGEKGEDEGVYIDDKNSEVTIYSSGGTIHMDAAEPYDCDLGVYTIAPDTTIGEGMEEETIKSIEKEGATFGGWTIYAVSKGEWVTEDVTDLADGQLCVPCGDYGYYFMSEYEVISNAASTEDMVAYKCDGRNYYICANWN